MIWRRTVAAARALTHVAPFWVKDVARAETLMGKRLHASDAACLGKTAIFHHEFVVRVIPILLHLLLAKISVSMGVLAQGVSQSTVL